MLELLEQSLMLENFTQQFEGGASFFVVSVGHDSKVTNNNSQ